MKIKCVGGPKNGELIIVEHQTDHLHFAELVESDMSIIHHTYEYNGYSWRQEENKEEHIYKFEYKGFR